MKAMILAAGKGERMRTLTQNTPKPLLRVANKPLLEHHLMALAAAGIHEIVINTWYLGEQIVAEIGTGERFGLSVRYSVESELLNTGGGIVNALPLLGTEPFLLLSADIFSDFPIITLPHEPIGLAHLVMVDNPPYKQHGDFALEKGKIKSDGLQKYTYGNIGIFRPEFFAHAPVGAFPLGELLRQHIAADLITGQYYNGMWHNVGTPEDLESLNLAFTDIAARSV